VADYRRRAENRDKRRTQLMRHGTNQSVAQQFRLRTHARIPDCLVEVEVFERSCCIREHRVHALLDEFRGCDMRTKIDRQDCEISGLSRYRTHNPGMPATVVDHAPRPSTVAPAYQRLGLARDRRRQYLLVG
jgi:hypothetical protein